VGQAIYKDKQDRLRRQDKGQDVVSRLLCYEDPLTTRHSECQNDIPDTLTLARFSPHTHHLAKKKQLMAPEPHPKGLGGQ
jgi:hypothetical protein